MSGNTEILVIVHPGSACGSAEMNLGKDNAQVQRLDMQQLIEGWEGGVVIIDGTLSDELEDTWNRDWHAFGQVLHETLARAAPQATRPSVSWDRMTRNTTSKPQSRMS